MRSKDRYVAVHKQTRTMYPKEGSFDALNDAVEFAKRRDPNPLVWSFGTVAAWDQRRRARAISGALKIAIRQLWDHVVHGSERPSEPPTVSDVPPPPRVPADAVKVPGDTIPAKPEPEPEPEHETVSPAVPPPAPDPVESPRERRRRRRRK